MDLVVPKGRSFVLSMAKPGTARKAISYIRPKSVRGLKRLLCLIRPEGLVDLSKSPDIELTTPTKSSVKLLCDDRGCISGFDQRVLKVAVDALRDDEPLQKSVLITNRVDASAKSARPAASHVLVELPKWLHKLDVFMPAFVFGDIRLEADATLEIEGDHPIELFADNFYAHHGAKVVQTAHRVHFQVSGTTQVGMA